MSISFRLIHHRLVMAGLLTSVVLGIGFLALSRCARRTKPNVLFITMDSLRPDHLGCYGYERAKTPNIDLLAVEFKSQQAQRREAELLENLLRTLDVEQLLDLRISSRHLKTDQATLQRLKALGYVY